MAFKHCNAGIEIIRREMCITHGHLQRLVAKPHLHTPDIDATAHQS
jgi:hypothetical protein